jgi:hypothetical protein
MLSKKLKAYPITPEIVFSGKEKSINAQAGESHFFYAVAGKWI